MIKILGNNYWNNILRGVNDFFFQSIYVEREYIYSHCDTLFPNKNLLFLYNEIRVLIYHLINLIIIIKENKLV